MRITKQGVRDLNVAKPKKSEAKDADRDIILCSHPDYMIRDTRNGTLCTLCGTPASKSPSPTV